MLDQDSAPALISPQRFQIGPFEFHVDSGELFKSGHPVRLPPQPSRVLAMLVRRAGEIVTREELQAAIWSDGTVVEFDQGLNFCIRQIRAALGEDARQPGFIETIPKRGYRFIAPVVPIRPEGLVCVEPSPAPRSKLTVLIPASIATALILAGGVWWNDRPKLPGTPEADRLFREAEHFANTADRKSAVERYKRVTELAPEFAPAWAGRSNLDVLLKNSANSKEAIEESEIHAKTALDLDPSLALALANLAHSHWYQWKWKEADSEFSRAVRLDPKEPVAHQLYGLYLSSLGRKAEAIEHAKLAVDLEPTSGLYNYSLGMVYLMTEEYEAAIKQAEWTLKMSRDYPGAWGIQRRAAAMLGDWDKAWEALEKEDDKYDFKRAALLAHMGNAAEARAIMDAFHFDGNEIMARIGAFAALGDYTEAFAVINRLIDRQGDLVFIKSEPGWRVLQSDPRFQLAMQRMGNP